MKMTGNSRSILSPRPVVILCAGEGRRLMEVGRFVPKAMVKIGPRPLISYVIDYWRGFAESFIFVVSYRKEQIISYINQTIQNKMVRFVDQKKPAGIAHAISCVEGFINDRFIVVLGDCICNGKFIMDEEFLQGVGVWKTQNKDYIKQSYSVEIGADGFLCKVVEKPSDEQINNDLCGMGFYFFNRKVFEYIYKTPPSSLRNEVEITDVIQKMIAAGEKIKPLYFRGDYLNVTSKDDIKLAERLFVEDTNLNQRG